MLSLNSNKAADLSLLGIIELLIMSACVLAIVLQLIINKLSFELIIGVLSVAGLGITGSGLLMRYFIEKVK